MSLPAPQPSERRDFSSLCMSTWHLDHMVARGNAELARLTALMLESGQRLPPPAAGGSGGRGGAASGAGGIAAGTSPGLFGADRALSETRHRIEADDLYAVFDPNGQRKQWTQGEIVRLVTALPDLNLPYSADNPSLTIKALDAMVFDLGIQDSTTALVDADISNGNAGFCTKGDVTNALDYHLWVLAMLLRTKYRTRPMHCRSAFDVSSLYRMRTLGITIEPPDRSPGMVRRYASLKFLRRELLWQICEAWGVPHPDHSDDAAGWSALLEVERLVAEDSEASREFWGALGDGTSAEKTARLPMACFAVVRCKMAVARSVDPASAPAGAPAPAPSAPAAPLSADMVFSRLFDGFDPAMKTEAKAMALQVVDPHNRRYNNKAVVGTGAYDDKMKEWIAERIDAFRAAVPSVPFTDVGALLRMVVSFADAAAAPAPAPAPAAAGGGGAGTTLGRSDRLLAEALDNTKMPSAKGEDGIDRLVPLPPGTLPLAQAEELVAKVDIMQAAVALGQTAAGADACANLGVMVDQVDAATGRTSKVRNCDALLNWALTQDIDSSTSAGGSPRAKAVCALNSAQAIVVNEVTTLIKRSSYGGENFGSWHPTPDMVKDMMKGMIIGSRPHVVRRVMTRRAHDYGPWMCVPMNVPNRPASTTEFFEWFYAVGAYSTCSRMDTVATKALDDWCAAMDACGDISLMQYQVDCKRYLHEWNQDSQRRYDDQQFLDLFLGGVIKLDRLNEVYQMKSQPSRKPRLRGVFTDGSMVSKTINECIKMDLITLVRQPFDRADTVFASIPILFPRMRYDAGGGGTPSPAPSPRASPAIGQAGVAGHYGPPDSGGRTSRSGGLNLQLPQPPPGVAQGTLLQLTKPKPASPSDQGRTRDYSREHKETVLPPAPRFGNILPRHELISGPEVKSLGVVGLFQSEPILAGKCAALLVREDGCDFRGCKFCRRTLEELPSLDASDITAALRRTLGSASARVRPGTPRRDRSDSEGSERSISSQRSEGGGFRPRRKKDS